MSAHLNHGGQRRQWESRELGWDRSVTRSPNPVITDLPRRISLSSAKCSKVQSLFLSPLVGGECSPTGGRIGTGEVPVYTKGAQARWGHLRSGGSASLGPKAPHRIAQGVEESKGHWFCLLRLNSSSVPFQTICDTLNPLGHEVSHEFLERRQTAFLIGSGITSSEEPAGWVTLFNGEVGGSVPGSGPY